MNKVVPELVEGYQKTLLPLRNFIEHVQ